MKIGGVKVESNQVRELVRMLDQGPLRRKLEGAIAFAESFVPLTADERAQVLRVLDASRQGGR